MRRFLSAIVALLLTFFVLSLPSELDEARDPRCRALSPRSGMLNTPTSFGSLTMRA